MPTKPDLRQSVYRPSPNMVGSSTNTPADTIVSNIDGILGKFGEDRNVLLAQGGLVTFTGTQVQFTEALTIVLNSKISGAAPQIIDLTATTRTVSVSGKMIYAVINRTTGTATVTDDATSLPAVTSANQEVFLIAKRVDAADGTQRLYFLTGMAMNSGQSLRLGSSGSGSGSGGGDDLITTQFQASFTDEFTESATASTSAVDSTKTNGTYSAAKGLYQLSYDAAKTVAAGTTTTNLNISAVAAFTVAVGDIAIYGSEAKRITAVATQASFTTEAFAAAPTLAGQVTISQEVHTKDIYGTAFDGLAISSAFTASFSEILIDYEDTTAVADDIFDIGVAPVIAFTASSDNTSYSAVTVRPTSPLTQVPTLLLPTSGTALYVRLFANKTSGTGTVNVLKYKAWMQKSSVNSSGGVLNSAICFTNGVGTPVNCTVGLLGGKTTLTLTWQYAVGVNSGTPYGTIDVYVNGQLIPRFINSTLTPDGSYTEITSTVIQLDKDYSAINISVEVLQRTVTIDQSSQNSTNIAIGAALLNEAGAIQNVGLSTSVAANALTIALKQADGSTDPTIGVGVSKIAFRSSTLTSGANIMRSISAALSVVIPSGTTLGTISGRGEYLSVCAIDNAGVVELAIGVGVFVDEGALVSTVAISGGTARGTLYSTTARSNVPVRLISRILITEATAGTWASNATALAPKQFSNGPRSEVWVRTANGYGSTNTNTPRFTNTDRNVGSAITYADNAANGPTWTINEDGIYQFTVVGNWTSDEMAFLLNVSGNATSITTNTGTNVLVQANTGTINEVRSVTTGPVFLVATDVVRFVTRGSAFSSANAMVAALKAAQVSR